MKTFHIILAGILIFMGLTGSSCNRPQANTTTDIAQAVIATGIKYDNQPENNLEEVGDSSPSIYLSAQVVRPTSTTAIRVVWYKLPNQILATETFSGKRTDSRNQFDFNYKTNSSWLSSRIERPSLSWPTGDYKTEVYIGENLAKTVFFHIATDAEAEKQQLGRIITSLSFGDSLTGDNRISSGKTYFSRTTPTIYIQVGIGNAPAGTDLEVAVRQVKTDTLVNTFSSVVSGNDTVLFSLGKSQFGRLWSDKLWPTGSFEVTAKINQTTVRTANFIIQG